MDIALARVAVMNVFSGRSICYSMSWPERYQALCVDYPPGMLCLAQIDATCDC